MNIEDEDDRPKTKVIRKKSQQQLLAERYAKGDPKVDLLGELSGKSDYYVSYPRSKDRKNPPFSFPLPTCEHLQKIKRPTLLP